MAGLPPLLRAFSLSEIGRVIQASAGAGSSVDFTPSHALTSVRGDRIYDANRADPWDLVADGPAAVASRSSIGQSSGFVHRAVETREHVPLTLWRALNLSSFNFGTQAWSVLYPWRYDRAGVPGGGCLMGNCVGPNPSDPYYPTQYYGANRGWGMSSNGDGGFGFLAYGADDYHNTDTVFGSFNAADGRWRWAEIGNNPNAKTTWMTVALRTDEIATYVGSGLSNAALGATGCADASATGCGDLTSPDVFLLGGANYYGLRQGNQDGAIGLPIVVFQGAAAINRWLHRFVSLPILQAQLEACE
jgi:hypothetical protein